MELMTLKKAAEYLQMNPEVLRRKAAEGSVPAKKLGDSRRSPWRFYKEELDKYLNWDKSNISKDDDTAEYLFEIISNLSSSVNEEKQIEYLVEIGRIGSRKAVPYLCELLLNENSSESLKVWSIRAMREILGADAGVYLRKFLNDKDEWVRIEAAFYFAELMKDRDAVLYLEEYYEKTKSFLVLLKLLIINPAKYLKLIKEKLLEKNMNQHDRLVILRELYKIEFDGIDEILKPLFAGSDLRVKSQLIKIVGKSRLKSFIPQLQEIIASDCSDNIKREAASALTEIFSAK